MFLDEACKAVEWASEPLIQGLRGGAGRRGGGTLKLSIRGVRVSQSVWSHPNWWWARTEDGEGTSIVIGTWSEPVEGRGVSHPLTNGRCRGLGQARSITEGHAIPERGNMV